MNAMRCASVLRTVPAEVERVEFFLPDIGRRAVRKGGGEGGNGRLDDIAEESEFFRNGINNIAGLQGDIHGAAAEDFEDALFFCIEKWGESDVFLSADSTAA
jgi:hypothetical protein